MYMSFPSFIFRLYTQHFHFSSATAQRVATCKIPNTKQKKKKKKKNINQLQLQLQLHMSSYRRCQRDEVSQPPLSSRSGSVILLIHLSVSNVFHVANPPTNG